MSVCCAQTCFKHNLKTIFFSRIFSIITYFGIISLPIIQRRDRIKEDSASNLKSDSGKVLPPTMTGRLSVGDLSMVYSLEGIP